MAILGVWMWPKSVRAQGAQAVVSRCAAIGVTDIFFLTKGLDGTTSCVLRHAPAGQEEDLLARLLDAAHAKGIRVHAWLTTLSDARYQSLHPQSRRCHFSRGKDKPLISLRDDGYAGYMTSLVSELCRTYPIDGLHLDYIRYNHLLYGWSEEDMACYARAGADIPHLRHLVEATFFGKAGSGGQCIFDAYRQGDESVHALSRVRRADVVAFARLLTQAARAENSAITLSAALMPEGAYEDTAFSDLHYGQNYDDAASLYDAVLPMAYSAAYEKDSRWVRQVAEGTLSRGLRTVMGLHAYDGGTGASLKNDIAALDGLPLGGICLFRDGAYACATMQGDDLHLLNTLDEPITEACTQDGYPLLRNGRPLLPGESACVRLDKRPEGLQIYTGSVQACVYFSPR